MKGKLPWLQVAIMVAIDWRFIIALAVFVLALLLRR